MTCKVIHHSSSLKKRLMKHLLQQYLQINQLLFISKLNETKKNQQHHHISSNQFVEKSSFVYYDYGVKFIDKIVPKVFIYSEDDSIPIYPLK